MLLFSTAKKVRDDVKADSRNNNKLEKKQLCSLPAVVNVITITALLFVSGVVLPSLSMASVAFASLSIFEPLSPKSVLNTPIKKFGPVGTAVGLGVALGNWLAENEPHVIDFNDWFDREAIIPLTGAQANTVPNLPSKNNEISRFMDQWTDDIADGYLDIKQSGFYDKLTDDIADGYLDIKQWLGTETEQQPPQADNCGVVGGLVGEACEGIEQKIFEGLENLDFDITK